MNILFKEIEMPPKESDFKAILNNFLKHYLANRYSMETSLHTLPQSDVQPKKTSSKIVNQLSKLVISDDSSIIPFSQIEVSTRTAIVVTNCFIDLDKLFEYIPIAQFEPVAKRRGRKKRVNIERPVPKLPFGSVINAQYEGKVRGTLLKPPGTFFLHCVVINIVIDDSSVAFGEMDKKNVKIYTNGKLQITGCDSDKQYVATLKAVFQLFNTIKTYTGEDVVTNNPQTYTAIFNTVMQNMNFYLGFNVCRESLDRFIKKETTYRSIYEGSITPGVSIKIPLSSDENKKCLSMTFDKETSEITTDEVNFVDYASFFIKKNKSKSRCHTFLIFASGEVIFTSAGADMEDVFNNLVTQLVKNRKQFEETA